MEKKKSLYTKERVSEVQAVPSDRQGSDNRQGYLKLIGPTNPE